MGKCMIFVKAMEWPRSNDQEKSVSFRIYGEFKTQITQILTR